MSLQDFFSSIELIISEIQELYQNYTVPWVIGVSWGKDSTCVLQLIWRAISLLPVEQRTKKVYVLTSNTLVENPQLQFYVEDRITELNNAAIAQQMPFEAHLLTPEVKDTFWVGCIGKGYSVPKTKFRWCTERLKIKPNNKFIKQVISKYGEVILVLGTRKAESSNRKRSMEKHSANRIRERLSPSTTLINSLVYTPIEDWTTEEVWIFLMQLGCPWSNNGNQELFQLYSDATDQNECAFAIDNTTQTCSKTSRFGCWMCTLVNKDTSMTNLIEQDNEQYGWMQPLLDLRNEMNIPNNHHQRDYRRMYGAVSLYERRKADNKNETEIVPIPGPYLKQWREYWLKRLLEVQKNVRQTAPQKYRDLVLISDEELSEIRRIWLEEKHEIDDSLPRIYEEVTKEKFIDVNRHEFQDSTIAIDELEVLKEICDDDLDLELMRGLLSVEKQYNFKASRKGIYQELTKVFAKSSYSKEESIELAQTKYHLKKTIDPESCQIRPAFKRTLNNKNRQLNLPLTHRSSPS